MTFEGRYEESGLKTVVALRHVPFEDLGTFEQLLTERKYKVHYHDVGVDRLSALQLHRIDLLVVLGGPIGAEQHFEYPFLREEIELIAARLTSSRPLLGICLGAQLIASALGSRVQPMGYKEIGFAPLMLTAPGQASALRALDSVDVLHWHGDRLELPAGATLLASTASCDTQAFTVGQTTLALQFHAEFDHRRIEQWLIGHATELHAGGVSPVNLRAAASAKGERLRAASAKLLDHWLQSSVL